MSTPERKRLSPERKAEAIAHYISAGDGRRAGLPEIYGVRRETLCRWARAHRQSIITPGDVVALLSDGDAAPPMTVAAIDGETVEVMWRDGNGTLMRNRLPRAGLRRI